MKYFDYAATCPIDEEALDAYVKASKEYFGNTSSLHDVGGKALTLLEQCRETIANLTGVNSKDISFTSGGTESNFLAIHALLDANQEKGNHIILSQSEHSSVQNAVKKLEQQGYRVSRIPLTPEGIIDLDILREEITQETALISIHHVNPEIGTIQPIEEISVLCKKYGILLHSDCVQSFGKMDLKQVTPLLDSFCLSSHKVYGPKGIGALYINPSLTYQPYLPDVAHEKGVRAGTVNVPAIAGFTVAAQKMHQDLGKQQNHQHTLVEAFSAALDPVKEYVEIFHPSSDQGFSSIVGLCVKEVEGQWLMLEGNRNGYAFSTGSACASGQQEPSKTLMAMGYSKDKAKTFIRISFGNDHTIQDVKDLAQYLVQTIEGRHQVVLQ
ncbi:cysteine desulfurase family protein [Pontibacillus sp. HMF3514]|uniref:cysteine desulfurase family protein n=1 Tax=Pontibacillus sp. HMF3514 TaxID=2692425 RepID=UPI0013204188|nr:IscS subfamily cysteine desulfurase [Pontibacillus sp. HMF3514]QHE53988.1 aminotransferase class V-fold PLP-dependent enzyme [Pontibacillus sp. HMF3514]